MKTLLEIEKAIKELPAKEARKLADWLNQYLDDAWDKQMQNDLSTGKLDDFIAKVESDIETNRVRDLNEILDNT
ncbi:hypothetical protein [Pleurocapsa sp. PCC 7319]|uniref:hypothetical protein n=1 Tax=Pleurocapsa sp. PCC 7319 TaxID=118161 RepID=UPI00034AB325|nr:hypothetical protein [Pleurocapsa sp. PCC 7319]